MRNRHWNPVVFAACAVLSSAAAALAAAPTGTPFAKPDLSTPKSAVAALVRAMEQGDEAALAAATAGEPQEVEWVRAQAAQFRSVRDLDAALAKRFGDAYAGIGSAKEIKERLEEVLDDDLYNDLKKAKVEEAKGDEVVLATEGGGTAPPPKLVREGGAWKLDLATLADYAVGDGTPTLRAVAKAAAELARDVAAGKFASVDEAAAAVDQRFTAAEQAGAAAEKTEKEKKAPPPPAKKP